MMGIEGWGTVRKYLIAPSELARDFPVSERFWCSVLNIAMCIAPYALLRVLLKDEG